MDLDQLVEKAVQSTLFTAPVLGPDLKRFLAEQGPEIRRLAEEAVDRRVEHIYWVGSGNSWVNLYSGKYLLDRFTDLPSDCFTSYEFIWRNPARLTANSWVFLCVFFGGHGGYRRGPAPCKSARRPYDRPGQQGRQPDGARGQRGDRIQLQGALYPSPGCGLPVLAGSRPD